MRSAQNVDNHDVSESLPCLFHAADCCFGRFGNVLHPRRVEAVQTETALVIGRLAEIIQNVLAQTARSLTIANHGLKALSGVLLNGLKCFALEPGFFPHVIDEKLLGPDVLLAEKQVAVRALAVAPGAAGLLIVAFDVLGHVVVDDKTHIGFVNAHAKGIGRDHHVPAVISKILLVALALRVGETGVIARDGDAVFQQKFIDGFHFFARRTVHNPGHSAVVLQKLQQRRVLLGRLCDGVVQILAVKTRDLNVWILQLQHRADIFAHMGSRCCGKGANHRPLRKSIQKFWNGQIAGAEILPPLRDAVGFIHGDHGDIHAHCDRDKARREQSLRGHVDDSVFSPRRVAQREVELTLCQRAVQIGGGDAALNQRLHLILHQGNQRRNDQRHAIHHQCWHLIAD